MLGNATGTIPTSDDVQLTYKDDAKAKHGIKEGFAPLEVQRQYGDALEDLVQRQYGDAVEDLENWIKEDEIDIEDILFYFIPDKNIYKVLKLYEYIKSDIEE